MSGAEKEAREAISRHAIALAATALEGGERTYEIVRLAQDLHDALHHWREVVRL